MICHAQRTYFVYLFVSMFTFGSTMNIIRCIMTDPTDILDCSDQGLDTTVTVVYSHERERIKIVDFSNNSIHQVDVHHQFPKVQELNLQFNSIENLSSDTFTSLELLERLNLSYNNIIYLDPFIFTSNKHLKSVSLRGNSIAVVAYKPIICSTSLLNFDLAVCGFSTITKENLLCLPLLTDLDLSSNNLVSLDPSAFINLNKLNSIFLRSNHFHCNCQLFELLRWAESKRSDMLSSQPLYCSLPNNKGITQFEEIVKKFNCSVQPSFQLKPKIEVRFSNTSKKNNTSIRCSDGNVKYYNEVGDCASLCSITVMIMLSVILLLLVVLLVYLIIIRHVHRRDNSLA